MTRPAFAIQPFCFGAPDRRLFGIFHPATAPATGAAAIVLCNAFGHEAIRAHRMMRVLAERLARAGHAVLRFDYFGTGDSMGGDLDGDLDGWAGDVHAADLELRLRSGAGRTMWLGMRLGGSVALGAARQAPQGLARLILWDPVIDGDHYLAHLRHRHAASLSEAYGPLPPPMPAIGDRGLAQDSEDLIGFAVSARLQAQVMALKALCHRWPACPTSIVAFADPADIDGQDLAAACAKEPGRVQVVTLKHGIDWTSDTAESTLVSAPALAQLLSHAELTA